MKTLLLLTLLLASPAIAQQKPGKCNLFNTRDLQPCCAVHDEKYRIGGKERDRRKADNEFFKCIWKKNKAAAPFMWVGVRIFGVFPFQRKG